MSFARMSFARHTSFRFPTFRWEEQYLEKQAVFKRNMDVIHCRHRHNIIATLSRETLFEYLDSRCLKASEEEFTSAEEWVEENLA